MKKKGFTLVELLVVIAIIAMLLAILMPALGKVRALAYRLMCGTNLGGIGKAIAVYCNDYQDMYPVLGPSGSTWCASGEPSYVKWDGGATPSNPTFDPSATPTTSVTSSMFLLVKYADVSTNQFVCKAAGEKKFELSGKSADTLQYSLKTTDITLCWDFGLTKSYSAKTGEGPGKFVSYSYQFPYSPPSGSTSFVANQGSVGSSPAGMAVMADRNPWYKTGGLVAANSDIKVNTSPYIIPSNYLLPTTGSPDRTILQKANSPNHQQEGQNVLYSDFHVSFENRADVGIELDNIYVAWGTTVQQASDAPAEVGPYEKQGGKKPTAYGGVADGPISSPGDNFLVN